MDKLKTNRTTKYIFWKLDIKSKVKLVLLFGMMSGCFNWTIAQSSVFNNYYLEQWDTDEGLPVDLVLTMRQSKEGFIWLRTYNGLIRFDGTSYEIFDSRNIPFLTSDNILGILDAPDSTLWVTSPFDGLWSYKNGKIEQALKDCNPGNRLYWLKSTKEVLFDNSNSDIPYIRYNPQTRERIDILPEQVDSLITSLRVNKEILSTKRTDQAGYEWWIWKNEIYRAKDGRIEHIEVRGDRSGLFFFDLLVDGQDRVWIPSTQGVFTYNGEFLERYPGMESARSLPVASFRGQKWVLEDQQGGIWFVLFGNIAYLPPGSQQFEFPPEDHPLRSLLITSMLEDHEGNIWFSSQSGLARLSQNIFDTYSREEGLANQQVEAVVPMSPEKYLIGTINSGLAQNENGNITPFRFKEEAWNDFPISCYHMFSDSKDNIWIGTRRGIYKISEDKEEWFARKTSVRFIFEDENGKLWFSSSRQGIGTLNKNGALEFLQFDSIDFQAYAISSIRRLSDGTWVINSFNQGLMLIDPKGQRISLKDDKGLSTAGSFTSYQEQDGTLWIPSQSGLYRLKDGVVDRLAHESGIPALSTFDFILDDNGFVWLPSNFGIIRVSKKELDDYLDGKIDHINWRIFDDGDGMRSRSCTGARHCAVMPDGRILVPTLDGLVEIDPDRVITNELPPPVVIHQFLWNDQVMDLTESIALSPGNSRFVFGYSGLSYKAPQKVQFRFRLKGYDKDWIKAAV